MQKTSSSNHTIKLVLDWQQTYLGENHDIPMSRERFKIEYCSEVFYSDYDYSGHLEYEFVTSKATTYTFTLLLSQRTLWDDNYNQDEQHGDTFLVFIDGEFADSIRQSSFLTPWLSSYSVVIAKGGISFNEQVFVSDVRGLSCEQIIGAYKDDFRCLTIVNGNENLSFYKYDPIIEYVGDTFYPKDYDSYPKIIYDTPYYGNDVKYAIIKGKVNNVIAYDTINIIPVSEVSIKVDVLPNKIEPGDTADILLKQKNEDGTLEEFSNEQIFNINLAEGTEQYGTLLAVNGVDTSDSFTDTQQGVKFIAKKEISLDSVEVLINVNALIGSEGESVSESSSVDNNTSLGKRITNDNNNSSNKKERIITPIDPGGGDSTTQEISGTGRVVVKKNIIEILLGQTKYLGVKKKGNKYKIAVTDTTFGVKPSWPTLTNGWEWVKDSTVWGDNPIEKLGSKSGVYWEKKWYDKTNNTNNDLPAGMIRLIGRYWEEGKEDSFKVKLKTTAAYNNAEVMVKVIEPKKLGNKYSKAKDVFDKVVNIDSLCIYYGGKNGIPPQFLKGHIAQESAKMDFGGDIGEGFAPSYRYEPYTTQNKKLILQDKINNPFYITATTTVNPPNHQHVKIIPYFSGDTITVWQIVKEHSQLVEDGNTDPTRMYGVRTHSDTMNYNAYPKIRNKYREFFDKVKNTKILDDNGNKRLMTLAEKADSTNKRMIKYLRDEFPFNDEAETKGMKNMIAQTRIASSYGYFQALYTTSLDWGYKEASDKLPENLNTFEELFPLTIKAYKRYCKKLNQENSNNWEKGFEGTVKIKIYPKWNNHKTYPNRTLNNVEKYLPQK